MSTPHSGILEIQLADFSSVDQREQLIEKALTANTSTVVVDATSLKRTASFEEFGQIVFFAKLLRERLQRYGRTAPIIKIIRPKDLFVLEQRKLDELRRVSGLDIEFI